MQTPQLYRGPAVQGLVATLLDLVPPAIQHEKAPVYRGHVPLYAENERVLADRLEEMAQSIPGYLADWGIVKHAEVVGPSYYLFIELYSFRTTQV